VDREHDRTESTPIPSSRDSRSTTAYPVELSYTYAVANDIIARVRRVIKSRTHSPDITWDTAWDGMLTS